MTNYVLVYTGGGMPESEEEQAKSNGGLGCMVRKHGRKDC